VGMMGRRGNNFEARPILGDLAQVPTDSIFTFFSIYFQISYFEYPFKSEFKIQVHMHKYNKTPACDVTIVLPIFSPYYL
jgi:hypothetical protein